MSHLQLNSLPIRSFLIALLLSVCGFAGNYLSLPVSFGVAFIFGSIFSIIGVRLLGIWAGVSIALAASSYTYLLWNHPYTIIIFTLEIIWIGAALQSGRTNILLIDVLYWIACGIPQAIIFHKVFMGLSDQTVFLVVLKLTVNGAFNALIAWIILSILPLSRLFHSEEERPRVTYEQVTFQVAAFFLMIPALGMFLLQSHREVRKTQDHVINDLLGEANTASHLIDMWLTDHKLAVQGVAALGSKYPLLSTVELQEELTGIHKLFPEFQHIFLGDKNARTVVFDPPVNAHNETTIGLNCKELTWFKELNKTGNVMISDVFLGKNGTVMPIFNICAPVMKDGKLSHFGVGAINLQNFKTILAGICHEEELNCTIVDRLNQVVISNDPQKRPLDKNVASNDEREVAVARGVSLRRPEAARNVSIMNSWQGAYFHASIPIPHTGWTLDADYSLAALQDYFYESNITGLTVLAIFLAVMLLIANIVSKMLGAPILSLVRLSKNLPERIEKGEEVEWPDSLFSEINLLIRNFNKASSTLRDSFVLVTEHKNLLEEAVERRTRELIQLSHEQGVVLDNANVGISLTRNRRQVWSNKKVEDLFGYTSAEIANCSTLMLFRSREEYEQVGEEAYRVLAEGKSYQRELYLRKKDGSDFLVRLSGKAINPHKADDGTIWIVEDITKQKENEYRLKEQTMQLESLTKNLEEQVEREISLRLEGEKMLVQQSKLAAMGEMLGAISHQWRQPLNTLGLIIQNLQEEHEYGGLNTELIDRAVEKAMEQIQHMSKTIDDFRNFVRPDKVRSKIELVTLMSECLRLFSVQANRNDITVRLTCTSCNKQYEQISDMVLCERIYVNGFHNELKHVFLNILSNARDAVIDRIFTCNNGGADYNPVILISFKHTAISTAIEIEDNGGGVSVEHVDRIFEPYFTTKLDRKGTGLGLYMSQLIVEHMGGTLTFVNGKEGAVFCVEIPVQAPGTMTTGRDNGEAVTGSWSQGL